MIHIGLFHDRQELARVGRQRFDIAPLPLRIERVEGERGFARPGQAGDHHQAIARDVEVDILQVVGACAPDLYAVHRGQNVVKNARV